MRNIFGVVCVLFVLGGCSKQNPVIERKEIVVQEDKRNISELQASSLLDKAPDPEALRNELMRIGQFHKLDFNYKNFWKSLRYPAFDITKINRENLEEFGLLGKKSCAINDSKSYVQFLFYLNADLKIKIQDLILKLISGHLDQCSPSYEASFYRVFLKEIVSIQSNEESSDSLKHSLNILKFLAKKNEKPLNKELGMILSSTMIRNTSKLIDRLEDLDLAIFFSALIKDIHPLNQKLALIPLNNFVGTLENVTRLINTLPFDESSLLLKKLQDKLPFDENTVKAFILDYLNKSDDFFLQGAVDEETKNEYLSSLQQSYEIFSAYNQNIKANLDILDSLAEKASDVLKTSSDLDLAEKRTSHSLVAATLLAKRLTESEFSRVLLPTNIDGIHSAALKIFKIKKASDHDLKLKLKNDFCKSFEYIEIKSLAETLSTGCFTLQKGQRDLTVSSPLKHSFFAVVDIDADKVTLKSGSNKTGVLNLSSQHKHEDVKSLVTPESHDAVVLPLLIGIHTENKKGVFLKGAKYYFFYHWVFSAPESGIAPEEKSLPIAGVSGGDLHVEFEGSNINFISAGSDGQVAPAASKGGKGYEFKFDEPSFEEWISDFIDYDSYLLIQNYKTKDNLNTLFKIAKRDEEKRIIPFIDPNYLRDLSPESQIKIDSTLDIINMKSNWGCSSRDCILAKASEVAMSEFSSLITLGEMGQLMRNISPEFKLEDGPNGPEIPNGQRGKDGKVFISNSY